jgi:hypothetical protein
VDWGTPPESGGEILKIISYEKVSPPGSEGVYPGKPGDRVVEKQN